MEYKIFLELAEKLQRLPASEQILILAKMLGVIEGMELAKTVAAPQAPAAQPAT